MRLIKYISKILKSKNIDELRVAVCQFGLSDATLEERSIVAAVSTPIAKKMLGQRENLTRHLEDLAFLCWRKHGDRKS